MIENIFVIISTEFEKDRCEYLKEYFLNNDLGVKITFFEALYKYKDESKLDMRYSNNLVLGEKCLFQNYINLFTYILNSNFETVLLLESDVIFVENFKEKLYSVLEQFRNTSNDNSMCFLGNACNLKYDINNRKSENLYLQMSSSCTDSIIIKRKAIENILNEIYAAKIISKPIDHYLNEVIINKNIEAYWCLPPIIIQGSVVGKYKPSVKDRF